MQWHFRERCLTVLCGQIMTAGFGVGGETSSVYIVSPLISPHLGLGAHIKEANSLHQELLRVWDFARGYAAAVTQIFLEKDSTDKNQLLEISIKKWCDSLHAHQSWVAFSLSEYE